MSVGRRPEKINSKHEILNARQKKGKKISSSHLRIEVQNAMSFGIGIFDLFKT
jgi:hypothetical protein